MSCSLTIDAVRDRRKTVTRRHVDTWRTLAAGDALTLVEKAMGLPAGARQVVLAEVEVVSVTVESLSAMTFEDITREGFDPLRWPVSTWIDWWKLEHGYRPEDDPPVRRIEWRYVR
jgi:hypothetical protein